MFYGLENDGGGGGDCLLAEISAVSHYVSVGYNHSCIQLSSHLFKADLSVTLALVLPI